MVRGFTSVVGDFLHPGHLAMIQYCRERCDNLTVGLICDPTDRAYKNKPIESVYERWYRLWSCKGVDLVIPLQGEKDLELAMRTLEIDVRFVGEEYKFTDFTGKETCEKRGIRIVYNPRMHQMSSTVLRKRVMEAEMQKK